MGVGEMGKWESGWLICLPKIYMNASQYEEVKDGARGRGVKGHAETKPKMAFPHFWPGRMKKEKRGSTWR